MITLNEFLTCVEWGFRQAEKGSNLEKALSDAADLWNKPGNSFGAGLMESKKEK